MLLELFLAGLALLLLAVLKDRKPAGMPPGPTDIPFFGSPPVVTTKAARELRDKYGSLATQRLGNMRTVFVADYSDVKDLFSRHEFSSRPELYMKFTLDETEPVGVLFNNGPLWSHGRRFILSQLRALGNGTSRLEEAVLTEVKALVRHLAAYKGKPVTKLPCFEPAVLNVIWQFTTGQRYDLDAEEVCSIFEMVEGVKRLASGTVLLSAFPMMSQLLPNFIKDNFFGQKQLREFLNSMRTLVEKFVAERQGVIDLDVPRDFINEYLTEMVKQVDEGDIRDRLRIEDLLQLLFDLFNTGSDTMTNMLRWATYYIARYPHIAARCREEMDQLLLPGEPVTLQHKQSLPLVEAFTTEVLRHSSMVVFLPHRQADRDVNIRGYTLPKGTLITTCTALIHRDPRHWTEPDLFSPDRFLDENGNFKIQRDGFLPFGIGRRQCVGEALARTEFFLFTAGLLQNFLIQPPDGVKIKDEPDEWLGIQVPAEQPFIFKLRHPLKDDTTVHSTLTT